MFGALYKSWSNMVKKVRDKFILLSPKEVREFWGCNSYALIPRGSCWISAAAESH